MADEDSTQETQESAALGENGEIRFSTEDAEPARDPAAAGTYAAGSAEPGDSPGLQILGAFVGAFVVAKLLQRLFGRD